MNPLPSSTGKTIAIISHGGTNRALISTALGIAPAQFHQMQQSNCGISSLQLPTGQLSSAYLSAHAKTIAHPILGNLPPERAGSPKLGKEFCLST